jgi:SLOG cluster2
MRQALCEMSDALVVLGGGVEKYKGRMPSIAEEVLEAIQHKQPVYPRP